MVIYRKKVLKTPIFVLFFNNFIKYSNKSYPQVLKYLWITFGKTVDNSEKLWITFFETYSKNLFFKKLSTALWITDRVIHKLSTSTWVLVDNFFTLLF